MNNFLDKPAEASTVLSVMEYPELKGMKEGDAISGEWNGKITSINGDKVTVTYTDLTIETENPADKEYSKMTKQHDSMNSDSGEEEDY